MAKEPQSAADYDDRTAEAVRSVLLEIGQCLGAYRGRFAIVGGAVPWLLLDNPEMPHVGTLDVDLSLDAESLGDGEYAALVDILRDRGYEQRQDRRRFQLVRPVQIDGGPPIDVVVDFLMPRNARIAKNEPPLIDQFAVQRADGAALALRFQELIEIDGLMPAGGRNRVEVAVASIPALLAMKGFALANRHKQKDAYDVYYCLRNYAGGLEALAEACRPLLTDPDAEAGYRHIGSKFRTEDDYGPTSVRRFVEDSQVLGERTALQWQRDAFGQVDAWLKILELRE